MFFSEIIHLSKILPGKKFLRKKFSRNLFRRFWPYPRN